MKNTFIIRSGGIGVILLSFLTIFLWFIFFIALKEISQKQLIEGQTKFIIGLTVYLLLCIYISIITYKYLACNFVELGEDELRISVSDYMNFRRSWPKYNKQTIKMNDIESVHLVSMGKFLPPELMIKRKSGEPYNINTKPFTKSALFKLFKEFEKRGIKVEIEIGTI
jgi:hypothetical protein